MANMCGSLFRSAQRFGVEPVLAAEGEWVDGAADFLTQRDDVTFCNGDPVITESVVTLLECNASSEFGSIYFGAFECADTIAATGEHEIIINFEHTDSEFLNAQASTLGPIARAEYIEEVGDTLGTPDGGVMCIGAYELESWNTRSTTEMRAYGGCWIVARH